MTIHPAQALSTTTAKAIEGSAPEVINIDLAANKQGFTVNGVFYSEASNNIKGNEVKEFSGDLSPANFIVKNFYYNSLDNTLNYADKDGDGIDISKPFLLSFTSKQWYDGNGKLITDTSNTMGCGSSYPMPLTLEITTQVKTYSKYGIPRESDYVPIVKRYKIAPKSELCAAKPNSAIIYPNNKWDGIDISNDGVYVWNSPNYAQRNNKTGGGYSVDYLPDLGGFKPSNLSTGKTFPTTGFRYAKFQLLMTGSQTDYKYMILSNHSKDIVDIDKNGFITLYKKPSGKVTARAILKRDEKVTHDYSFEITALWIVPQGDFVGSWQQAQNRCNGIQNVVTRKELTNSPLINLQVGAGSKPDDSFLSNSYTRSIDGTVLSEWGWADENSYPNSGWRINIDYWSSDSHIDGQTQFIVHSHDGFIGWRRIESSNITVACRG
ncbi:hypothetical protein A9G09_10145 [Gilliamella sp. wkB292]|uniref:hypothetical protein n=1 Tax=Gilliamella sp. wkB292 TaxID=3120262 RepID=UPI00080DD35A|nr:hypothetical protein [Gilliamella apicola]OCG11968.1 hypothetical protein A9G09_10145 [Gilliamella apicola]